MKRPNVLVIMPDSLRADALGCFGSPIAKTPALDALAARGTTFTQTFCQHTVCSPSRVSMLTGWYPHVRGHRTLSHLIQPDEPNMFQAFHDGGYHISWIGRVMDTFAEGLTNKYTDYSGYSVETEFNGLPAQYPAGHRLGGSFYYGEREQGIDQDEAATQTAVQWLDAPPQEPWMLYVTLIHPHPPYLAEEPWFSLHDRDAMPAPLPPNHDGKPMFMREMHKRYDLDQLTDEDWREIAAVYHGMVSRLDEQTGRILAALEASGEADNTIVVFHTDHGEYLGDYGLVEKWVAGLDDCLARNPLIMAGPGIGRGQTSDALVELIDLYPTLAECAGIDIRGTQFGRSFTHLFQEPDAGHRDAAFTEGGHPLIEPHALEQRYPLPPYDRKTGLQQDRPILAGKAVALRTHDWTYVHRVHEGPELYNRHTDPGETTNLIGTSEGDAVAADLRTRMLEWMIETADVVPTTPDPRFDRSAGGYRPR